MNQICERAWSKSIPYWIDRSGSNTFGKQHDVIIWDQICERAWNQKYSYWIDRSGSNTLRRKLHELWNQKYSYWIDRSGSNTFEETRDVIIIMNQICERAWNQSIPTGSIDLLLVLLENNAWAKKYSLLDRRSLNTQQKRHEVITINLRTSLKPKYSYWIDRSGSNTLGTARCNNMNQIRGELETKVFLLDQSIW
jgi:phage gp46-like protein